MPKPSLSVPHHQQAAEHTCLPACVRMVLAYHGVEKPEDELAKLLETDSTGTAAAQVHRIVRYGFLTVLYEATLSDLQRYLGMGIPCIALVYTIHLPYYPMHQAGHHAVVVAGLDEGAVYVHDPLQPTGPTEVPRDSFEAAWQARRHRLILITRFRMEAVEVPDAAG